MSKKTQCQDVATVGIMPSRIFFGHFKDESNIKACKTFDDLQAEIDDYMIYNNFRYQWNLKKMTPVQYRNHLHNSL